jgi:glyoxylase-like metal-dependent hydrolase (beta-lactamase superfamily II)
MSSRRGFLSTFLGPVWTGGAILDQAILRAARARAQAKSATSVPRLFDIRKVAEGVFVAQAKPVPILNCNAVIFENDSDVMIVDAHSKPSAVISLLRQIRDEVTTKQIRYVVASHFHWDHAQGLPAYRRIAPRADILATEVTRRLINEQTGPRLKASIGQMQKQLEEMKKAPAEERARLEQTRRETLEYISEMKNYTPELPNVTVTDELIIHDKAHDLHLIFSGRAHTGGDVAVWCPQKKVVATGDMLHPSSPFLGDGYPLEWPRTLLKLAERDFSIIAGGHGAPQSGKSVLYKMSSYIEEISEAAVAARRAGKTLAQLQAEVTPDKLFALRGGYGDLMAQTILTSRYSAGPKPAPAAALADAVKTNLAHVWEGVNRS